VEISGREKRALIGQRLSDLLTSRDQALLGNDILQSMNAKVPWKGLLRLSKEDGGNCWVQSTVIPVTGFENNLSEMAVVATDITSTQQDVAEETFNDTLELIEDPVVVLHPKTLDIHYCNRAADNLLIKQRVGGDWKNRAISEVISSEDLDVLRMRVEAVVEGPQRRVTWEKETQTGVSFEISLEYVVPDMDEPSLVVMYRDLTERKAAERAKSEFVSTVSHELRTPLTSMKAALKMASSGLVGEVPDKMQDLLSMANRNTDRLVTLINDILDLEKIEADKMVYDFEQTDLIRIIEQAVEANSFYAGRFSVTLVPKIDEADAPYTTMVDHNRMMQVMDNLLSNAAKFSHEGGEVHINLFRYKGWMRMSIRDFGTGIPEASQPKIFGKFVQSDSSDTRAKGGTGLGLAIIRPIIAAHKGAISFHSEEGVGTEFFVDLPSLNGEELSVVELPDDLIAPAFTQHVDTEMDSVIAEGSDLLHDFERHLRRSGWQTGLEIGQISVQQVLKGTGTLGRAIAASYLDDPCRSLLSDLTGRDLIETSPVCILEANYEESAKDGEASTVEQHCNTAINDWLRRLSSLMANSVPEEPREVRVLLVGELGIEAPNNVSVSVIHVANSADVVATIEQEDAFDLVLKLTTSESGVTALILPLSESKVSAQLPITVFAGRLHHKENSLGVVSKFNRVGASSNTGKRRMAT
jgi:signal transduction histidine kinase